MAQVLETRTDGSVALYIDGDLQFDSRDERVYHEALALPAVALAAMRFPGAGLRVLVCGGGDGLAVRELLKCAAVSHVDVVDLSAEIVALARTELAGLDGGSLDDPRVTVHIGDAWRFVEAGSSARPAYHLVICDLTVPQDAAGARLQGTAWYGRLRAVLLARGVLAANGVSPSAHPRAAWIIANSIRAAGLYVRPYRVAIPSFSAAGYGPDWAFMLASTLAVKRSEVIALRLPAGREVLAEGDALTRLFRFPAAFGAMRNQVPAAADGSAALLAALRDEAPLPRPALRGWDSLHARLGPRGLPPVTANTVLPAALSGGLGWAATGADEEAILGAVLELMPSLHRGQTSEMVAAFVEEPRRFLSGIDLDGLVRALLARASELPRRLVAELRHLRQWLRRFAADRDRVLTLGLRVMSVVALVVIFANLMLPDAVYGKGGEAGASNATSAPAASSLSRPAHAVDTSGAAPELATARGFQSSKLGTVSSVDETGTLYPTRSYRYFGPYYGYGGYNRYHTGGGSSADGQPKVANAAYKLTPETDVLGEGEVAVNLTDNWYLLLGPEATAVIDRSSGEVAVFLQRDPTQAWRASRELDRQRLGLVQSASQKDDWISWFSWLDFLPGSSDDRDEAKNLRTMAARLETARENLGPVPDAAPGATAAPVAGAVELFSGAWIVPDGSALAILLPDGPAFMDGKAWYRDPAATAQVDRPYPEKFRAMVKAFLTESVTNQGARAQRLAGDLGQLQRDLALLEADRVAYTALQNTMPAGEKVDYGSGQLPLSEALQRTFDDITRTQQLIDRTQSEIKALPTESILAQKLLKVFGG